MDADPIPDHPARRSLDWRGAGSFVLYTTGLAVAYGILHDLVTANVSVEYFTVYHPHLVDSKSPFVMALLWGVIATWWVGLPAGVILALANMLGRAPGVEWGRLKRRTTIAMAILLAAAMGVLVAIYLITGMGNYNLSPTEVDHRRRLMSVAVTHAFSYAGSVVAVFAVAIWIVFERAKEQ